MNENQLAKIVVDAAFRVHTKLGPGLLETVYEVTLAHELRKRGLVVQRQVPVPIQYDEIIFDEVFRADLIVNDILLVELKSVETLAPERTGNRVQTIQAEDGDVHPDENEGVEGIERNLDPYLHGHDGFRFVERDRTGRELVPYRGQERAAHDSSSLRLRAFA